MKIITKDIIIKAKVEEKNKAEEKYIDAISSGHTAYLGRKDENSPDIMKLNIGNLEPNADINIELIYVQKIEADGEEMWRFMLPTTITPKYGANSATSGFKFINNKIPNSGDIDTKFNINVNILSTSDI